MPLLEKKLLLAVVALLPPTTPSLGTRTPHLENEKAIHAFVNDVARFTTRLGKYHFQRSVKPLPPEYEASPQDKVITYSRAGDTIQYYRSFEGKTLLLYCRLHQADRYANDIPFVRLRKPELVPVKWRSHAHVMVGDRAGFEDLSVTFVKDQITQLLYIGRAD